MENAMETENILETTAEEWEQDSTNTEKTGIQIFTDKVGRNKGKTYKPRIDKQLSPKEPVIVPERKSWEPERDQVSVLALLKSVRVKESVRVNGGDDTFFPNKGKKFIMYLLSNRTIKIFESGRSDTPTYIPLENVRDFDTSDWDSIGR